MPLAPGIRLGPYEIIAPIGAGGMGEVYRARDTRLNRSVAVKILPPAFADDADRVRRFEQEAQAAGGLNHPNILAVYDFGSHERSTYVVSELLEGETLREAMHSPIPARKAVEYAVQVARGLAAAHAKGITHRDIKPENLFLTKAGFVKILDFGLAKVTVSKSTDQTSAPTTPMETDPGVVMGTAGYMSPEQVRGTPVDPRSDIFSLGAVLYEMLSGRRAFSGNSSAETMSAILRDDPADMQPGVPPSLARIVRRCLEKKAEERFESARDLAFALESASSGSGQEAPVAVAPAPKRAAKILPAAAALGAVLLAVAAYWAGKNMSAPERQEFAITVPGEVSHLALSPDGRWLAFISPGESGAPVVFVQRIGSPAARAIVGSEGASYPFWSPDDVYVAFFAHGKLCKTSLAGGSIQNIITVGIAPRGGSWNSKGVILYARDSGGGLWRVNADGSGEAPVTEKLRKPVESSHRWPIFLPDGDHFLMFAGSFGEADDPSNAIYLSSLSNLGKIPVAQAHSSPAYSAGRMYYVDSNGALVSTPLDVSSGKTGAAQVMAPRVARSPSTYYATFAASADSTLVYIAEPLTNNSQLTWFDETGKELGRPSAVGVMANPALSPDGSRVAYDVNDFKAGNVDLWIVDLAQSRSSRFTFDPAEEVVPAWSRDGSTIAFRNLHGGASGIVLKKANGLEPEKNLPHIGSTAEDIMPNSWSPGDTDILCTVQTEKGTSELVLQPAGGGPRRPFLSGAGSRTNGQISPDGKWVAYASNETGEWEIYVTDFPAAAGKWQVSNGGGSEPRWRGDGKAIFYIGSKQMLTEVTVGTEGAFSTGAPRALFAIHSRAPISSTDIFTYDVSRDGKRFLVNEYVKPERAPPLNIVLHAAAK